VLNTYEALASEGPIDPELLYDKLRSSVGRRVAALTGRRPIIVPVIIPVGEVAQSEAPPDDGDPPADPDGAGHSD